MPALPTGKQVIAVAGNNTIDIAFGRSLKLYSVYMYNRTSNCAYNCYADDGSGRNWYVLPIIPTIPKANASDSGQRFFPQGIDIRGPFRLRFRFLQCLADDELNMSWSTEVP